MATKVSPRGLVEIASHEGIVNAPHRDSKGIWTVGIGHTASAGDPDPAVKRGEYSMTEALYVLGEDKLNTIRSQVTIAQTAASEASQKATDVSDRLIAVETKQFQEAAAGARFQTEMLGRMDRMQDAIVELSNSVSALTATVQASAENPAKQSPATVVIAIDIPGNQLNHQPDPIRPETGHIHQGQFCTPDYNDRTH